MKMEKMNKKSIVILHGVFGDSFFDILKDKNIKNIFITEGRPSCEAAKNNSKALLKRKIKPTLICDNMAGFLFYKKLVKEVWISYYEEDKNGLLCDIGAMIIGLLAKKHNIPVFAYPSYLKRRYIAPQKDIMSFNNIRVAPYGIKAYVPLLEWVPGKVIKG